MGFMIEGTWRGYRSSQDHVCHREFLGSRKFAEKVKAIHSILFTDGTALILSVKEYSRRPDLKEINGYYDLIRDCVDLGVTSVQQVADARKAKAGTL